MTEAEEKHIRELADKVWAIAKKALGKGVLSYEERETLKAASSMLHGLCDKTPYSKAKMEDVT